MKNDMSKLNLRVTFSPKRLKCSFGYGKIAPKNCRTWYMDSWPEPQEAVEELKEMVSEFLDSQCKELYISKKEASK